MKNLVLKTLIISFLSVCYINSIGQTADSFHFKEAKRFLNENLDSCYSHIKFFENKPNKNEYNYLIGLYYNKKNQFNKSNIHLLASIKDQSLVKSPDFYDVYYFLGINYYYLGFADSAIIFFKKEIQLEKNHDLNIKTAGAFKNIAAAFRSKSEVDSSIHYNNLALVEFQNLKDTLGQAKVHNNLGNLYRNFVDDIAIKHYLKALSLYEVVNDPKNIAITKHNLGILFIDVYKYAIGLEYLEKSYEYFLDNNVVYYQVITLNNIGYAYLNLKENLKAEKALLKSVSINTEFEEALAFSYLNLGENYRIQNNYTKAQSYLEKALVISKKNNFDQLLVRIYSNLVSLSALLNDYQKFEKFFSAYNIIIDEVDSKEKMEELAKFEKQFEIKKSKHLLNIAIKDKIIKGQEIEQHKTELSLKNKLIFFGGLVILILTILIGIIIRFNKKQKKLNLAIKKQNSIIKNHNTELEVVVDKRTKELSIAKKKAEESDLLKSTFLANISHEIRTPLNSIMGFSDLLSEDVNDLENIRQYGTIIRNKGYELLNIINDIIDVSKIEANMFAVNAKEIKYSKLIEAIENNNFDKSKYFDKESIIDYRTSFYSGEGTIKADIHKLEIVFDKLINNAFQFTETGFIEIGSSIQNNKIEFYVSDSGIGIPEERLIQIFEDFRKFRIDQHIKYHGLGVGLYIAHNILLKMGSELNIESRSNKGSTFSFSLQIHE